MILAARSPSCSGVALGWVNRARPACPPARPVAPVQYWRASSRLMYAALVGLSFQARHSALGADPCRAAGDATARAALIVYGNRRRCFSRFIGHYRTKLRCRFIRPSDRSRFRRRSLIRLNWCGGFCWRLSRVNRCRICWRSIRIRRLVGLWSGPALRHLASLDGCGCGRNFGRGFVQLNRLAWQFCGPRPRQSW